MALQVFLSHSQEDQGLYSSLAVALDGSGIVRWDPSALSPGQPLADELRAAIEACDVCVFLATSRSLKSRWCMAELGAFWGAGKKVIIYMADPKVKEADLPPQFHGNLWTADAVSLIKALKATDANRVRSTANGYALDIKSMTIGVSLGRIEESEHREDRLVALPANEYFDDECIHDARSSLGAFFQHHFKNDIPAIQELVRAALMNEPAERVEKTPGTQALSYGIGKCVFLPRPLGSPHCVAMVSVTTQRANLGLHADAGCVFSAVTALQRLMANNRLTRLTIPVIGGGHGGLKKEVSLLCMLIAFSELGRKTPNHIKDVDIVVYRSSSNAPASIPETTIKRGLEFAGRFLAH